MGFDYYWNLFYLFVLRFALQLVFCEGLFCKKLKRRKNFAIRLFSTIILYIALSFGFFVLLLLFPNYSDSRFPYYLQIPYYLIDWSVTLLVLFACFKVKLKETMFVAVGGYALQHLIFSIVVVIKYFITYKFGMLADNLLYEIIPFLVFGAVAYFALISPGEKKSELRDKDVRFLALAAVLLSLTVILSVFSRTFRGAEYDVITKLICRPYGIISCLLVLILMYGLTKRNKLEHDNELMELLFHMEKEQQQDFKENIEIINIKCHDLKNQISLLRQIDNKEERIEAIAEVEKAVRMYDNTVKSGNDALDLILTQKNMLCENYNIKLSCIIDGASLGFMRACDIYALFGNSLDNAIEEVRKESDPSQRIISLRVSGENNMLFIHMDNYCSSPLFFDEGIPLTTKADKNYHGFGTRSITYIVKKYKGDVNMYLQDGKYNLDILFALREKASKPA